MLDDRDDLSILKDQNSFLEMLEHGVPTRPNIGRGAVSILMIMHLVDCPKSVQR